MYFSTFEPIGLTLDSIMQHYICPVANAGARPQHSVFHRRQQSHHYSTQFQRRLASWNRLRRHKRDRCNCSRPYKVSIWIWRYGRGSSRMVSIVEAERIRRERIS